MVERRRCSGKCTPYNKHISELVNHKIVQLFDNISTEKKIVFIIKGTSSFGNKAMNLMAADEAHTE